MIRVWHVRYWVRQQSSALRVLRKSESQARSLLDATATAAIGACGLYDLR